LEIYIDWPSDPNRDPTEQKSGDPLNSHALSNYKFDCHMYLPDGSSIASLAKVDSIPKKNSTQAMQVDWGSAKHHIITFQFCFEDVHSQILAAREWAAKSPVPSATRKAFIDNQPDIQNSLNELVGRLDAFMILTMWRIESIRHRYRTKGYFCHLYPVTRWCS
jgi:hypothetical protein